MTRSEFMAFRILFALLTCIIEYMISQDKRRFMSSYNSTKTAGDKFIEFCMKQEKKSKIGEK